MNRILEFEHWNQINETTIPRHRNPNGTISYMQPQINTPRLL